MSGLGGSRGTFQTRGLCDGRLVDIDVVSLQGLETQRKRRKGYGPSLTRSLQKGPYFSCSCRFFIPNPTINSGRLRSHLAGHHVTGADSFSSEFCRQTSVQCVTKCQEGSLAKRFLNKTTNSLIFYIETSRLEAIAIWLSMLFYAFQ